MPERDPLPSSTASGSSPGASDPAVPPAPAAAGPGNAGADSDNAPEDFRANPPAFAGWIGVARRDVTPPVGIYARQWGAATHDVAEGVHRPLCATVLVMRESAQAPPLVLIALDAFMFRVHEDEQRLRDRVRHARGLEAARVILNTSHTHASCSVSTCDADKPGGHLIGPYLQQIGDAVAKAAQEAMAHAQPATMTWGVGRCGLAANRDLPEPGVSPADDSADADADASGGGRFVCGFNPSGPADDTLLVGRVTAADDDRVLATVVNYACHPTTLAAENRLISPDYVGAMRQTVERHTADRPCLFLQGASGELAPAHQYTGDTAVADAHGRQLGLAALAVLEGMPPPRRRLAYQGCIESGAPLAIWTPQPFDPATRVRASCFEAELPLKPLPDEQTLRDQLASCSDRVMSERLYRKLQHVRHLSHAAALSTPAPSTPSPTTATTTASSMTTPAPPDATDSAAPAAAPVPIWIWEVGDALFIAQPNEAYASLQVALRRRFPRRAVVVMNVSNGCSLGYLHPPEYADLDIYQVWQSPFDRRALPVLTDRCIREAARLAAS